MLKCLLKVLFLFVSFHSLSQGLPGMNTDESKVTPYTLPDPLKKPDGTKITTVKQWEKQRQYWLKQFSEHQYGVTPKNKLKLRFKVLETKNDALNGLAIRKRISIYVANYPNLLPIELILYVPKADGKPVPVFVSLNYGGNQSISFETDIPISERWMPPRGDDKVKAIVNNKATENSRGFQAFRWPLEEILSRGYAVATAYYGDVEPDHPDGWRFGVRAMLGDTAKANNWGAIGSWAWGLSRMLDYLETDKLVDASKSIVLGHSRLGKAAVWAGAQDKRFAIVISNNSGFAGAKITRRNFGEKIGDYDAYRYCKKFYSYIGRITELPVDQHILLSLIAPRPLYVASASNDLLADPKGEFLSAVYAAPVYALYGKTGLGTDVWPEPDKSIGHIIGYHIRKGEHNILSYDWERYMDFADKWFK